MASPLPKMICLGFFVLLIGAIVEATPPGIAMEPKRVKCNNTKFKYCNNLEHVCPKFCPDTCTVDCVSCKPICGADSSSSSSSSSSSASSKPPSSSSSSATSSSSKPPSSSSSSSSADSSSSSTSSSPSSSSSSSSSSAAAASSSGAPPPSSSSSSSSSSTSTSSSSSGTPFISSYSQSPSSFSSSSSSPRTPLSYSSTPSSSSSSGSSPSSSSSSSASSSSPGTPPSSSSTPSSSSSSASSPSSSSSSSSSSSTPTTSSSNPHVYPTPTKSPPTPSSTSGKKRVRCRNKNYSCYGQEHFCPANCPTTCEVDCATCKPVCRCDYPGAVCQDPRFIGGDGITFYFHGKKDKNYCLITDPNLHINGHFIGKRSPTMTRDFTWVQSIGILFDNHRLFVGAQKTAMWDDSVDRLALTLDNEPIFLQETEGATWQSTTTTPRLTITRTASDTNSIVVQVEGRFKITVKVVPISRRESGVHNYGITSDDCFAHLDLGFKFYSLSGDVEGVLGKTYRGDYVSKINVGAKMPVLGGEREYETTGLFATDCKANRFVEVSHVDGHKGFTILGFGLEKFLS